MTWVGDFGDWVGGGLDSAWNGFTGLFEPDAEPSWRPPEQSSSASDYQPDFSVPDLSVSASSPGGYSFLNPSSDGEGLDVSQPLPSSPTAPRNPYQKPEHNWYDALLSGPVLGSIITSGAGLIGGLNQLDLQKQAQKAKAEEDKMNRLLELAKLKYQLMSKSSGGGGRPRAAPAGPSGPSAEDKWRALDAQLSGQISSGYTSQGANLASLYTRG